MKDAQNPNGIARDTNLAKEIFGSNLLLGKKQCAQARPIQIYFWRISLRILGKIQGETQWAAQSAAHNSVSQKPLSSILVPPKGLEPLTFWSEARRSIH